MSRCPNCRRPVGKEEPVCDFCGEQLRRGQNVQETDESRRGREQPRSQGQGRTGRGQDEAGVQDNRTPEHSDKYVREDTGQSVANRRENAPPNHSTHQNQPQAGTTQNAHWESGRHRNQRTRPPRQNPKQGQSGPVQEPTDQHGRRSRTEGRPHDIPARTPRSQALPDRLEQSDLALGAAVGVGAFVLAGVLRTIFGAIDNQIHDETEVAFGAEFGISEVLIDHLFSHGIVQIDATANGEEISGHDFFDIANEVEGLETGAVAFAMIFVGYYVFAPVYLFAKRTGYVQFNTARYVGGVTAGYAACLFFVAAALQAEYRFVGDTVTVVADPVTALLAGVLFGTVFGYLGLRTSRSEKGNAIFAIVTVVWLLFVLIGVAVGPGTAA